MRAARHAEHAYQIGTALEGGRASLEPADGVVDVSHGARIGRVGRHAEVEGGHYHSALGEGLVDDGIALAGAHAPRPAVEVDDQGEGALALGLEEPGEERLVAVTEIFHILDVDAERSIGHDGSSGARERVGGRLLGYVVSVRGTIVPLTGGRNPLPTVPGTGGAASPRRRARLPGSPRY